MEYTIDNCVLLFSSDCEVLPSCLWCQPQGEKEVQCSPVDRCDFRDLTSAQDTSVSTAIYVSVILLFLLVVHLIILFICYRTEKACFSKRRMNRRVPSRETLDNRVVKARNRDDISTEPSELSSNSGTRRGPVSPTLNTRAPEPLPRNMKPLPDQQDSKNPSQRSYMVIQSAPGNGGGPTQSMPGPDSGFFGAGSNPSTTAFPSSPRSHTLLNSPGQAPMLPTPNVQTRPHLDIAPPRSPNSPTRHNPYLPTPHLPNTPPPSVDSGGFFGPGSLASTSSPTTPSSPIQLTFSTQAATYAPGPPIAEDDLDLSLHLPQQSQHDAYVRANQTLPPAPLGPLRNRRDQ